MSTDQSAENRPEFLDRDRLVVELTHARRQTRDLREQPLAECAAFV